MSLALAHLFDTTKRRKGQDEREVCCSHPLLRTKY